MFSSENTKIHSFYQFVDKVHSLPDCRKKECDIGIFWGCLRGVFFNPEKTYEEQRSFFLSYCANFFKVFRSMINLKKYVLTLLEGLKFLRAENKSLTEKLTEKENLKRKLNEKENLKCEKGNLKQLVLEKEFLENKLEKILTESEVEKENCENEHPAVPMTFETKRFYNGETMTLEEKISFYLENLSYFADSCTVIHESSQCMLEPYLIKCFSDELFSYVSRRRSPRLESSFSRNFCVKYPQDLYDIFFSC